MDSSNRTSPSLPTLQRIVDLLDQKIVVVNYGLYFLAFGSLFLVANRVKPFKKFTKPTDIPANFIKKNVPLKGTVVGIDFRPKPVLLIDHRPLLFGSLRSGGPSLPASFEGINLSANGLSWLQVLAVGQDVSFVVLGVSRESASCIVSPESDPRKDLGRQLVEVGFAKVEDVNPALKNNKQYRLYYNSLLKSQQRARHLGRGMWIDEKKSVLASSSDYLFSFLLQKVFPWLRRATAASFRAFRTSNPLPSVSLSK